MSDDELKALLQSLRRDNAALVKERGRACETRRHFDVVIEECETQRPTRGRRRCPDEEELARLETKVEQTAAETQAMIKFSHADLDRVCGSSKRTQSKLEDAVSRSFKRASSASKGRRTKHAPRACARLSGSPFS